MGKPTEKQFYERLNEIDSNNDYGWLMTHCICALSGGVVGFIIGYFVAYLQ